MRSDNASEGSAVDAPSALADMRAVLETLPDPYVVLEPIRDDYGDVVDFVFIQANAAACEINRLAPSSAPSMSR